MLQSQALQSYEWIAATQAAEDQEQILPGLVRQGCVKEQLNQAAQGQVKKGAPPISQCWRLEVMCQADRGFAATSRGRSRSGPTLKETGPSERIGMQRSLSRGEQSFEEVAGCRDAEDLGLKWPSPSMPCCAKGL